MEKKSCQLVAEHLGSFGGSKKCPSTQWRSYAGVSSTDFEVFKRQTQRLALWHSSVIPAIPEAASGGAKLRLQAEKPPRVEN